MEYISAEEFLKQSKEIQKLFLDWWDWETFDLFSDKNARGSKYSLRYVINNNLFISLNDVEVYTHNVVPLLVESQLRQFIEDETGLLLEVHNFGDGEYSIHLNNSEWVEKQYNKLEKGLLQAYWKVACEIAKEEIE